MIDVNIEKLTYIIKLLQNNSQKLKDRIDGEFFQSLQCDSVIYSHISHINEISENVINDKHSLIVRDGDTPFTYELLNRFNNFNHIYCQNNQTLSDKTTTIPIGMESTQWCYFDKFEVIKRVRCNNITPNKLLYGNFSISTNTSERNECFHNFCNKDYFTNHIKISLKHPTQLSEKEYIDFCVNVLSHYLMLCPVGNGIDTHRMWETIWLGRIPVVLRNTVTESFKELPLLILDKWSDFDVELNKFVDAFDINNFNFDVMTKEYWRNKIT